MTERNIFMKNKKILYLIIIISVIGLFASNLDVIEKYITANINFLISYYSEDTYLFLLIEFLNFLNLSSKHIGIMKDFLLKKYLLIIVLSLLFKKIK